MNVNSTIASVGLALVVIVSVFPPGMVGTAGAQDAPPDSDVYTVMQNGNCYVVDPYEPGDENRHGPGDIEPHVKIVDWTHEFGDVEKSSWDESPTIESVMDYRYRIPEDTYENQTQDWGQLPEDAPWLGTAYWKDPYQYGTYGLWNWSENQESHMFFYDGPEGDSLVIRHDKLYDDLGIGSHGPYNGRHPDAEREGYMTPQPGGGAVSFTFENLPPGEWAYMDDMYPHDMDAIYYDSAEFEYDPDRHTRYGHPANDYGAVPLDDYGGGTDFTVHWTWNDHGTDGGAYRGLENLGYGDQITITPRFNQSAYLWDEIARWEDNPNVEANHTVDDWVIRRQNGEFVSLDMTEPITIMRGAQCAEASLTVEPSDPEVGERAVLNAGGSSGGNLQYSWDIDGDGEYERNGTDSRIGVVYDENLSDASGVSVRVESGLTGVSDTASASLTVQESEPPSANVTVEPGNAGLPDYHVEGEQLTFDARNSTDNGRIDPGTIVWDFGENSTNVTGEWRATHRFEEEGTHEVSLTVGDQAGNTDSVTEEIEIHEPDTTDPEADLDVSPTEFEGHREVAFDASGSDDDRRIADYYWDWNGDGSVDERTDDPTATFAPPYRGGEPYNVTVRVADGNGNTANESVEVNVTEPQRPTVHNVTADGQVPSAANITAGDGVDLSVNASDNVGVDAYHWDLDGDGGYETTTDEATLTTDFSAGQDQNVGLRVSDAAGHNASRTVVLNVDPAPVADLAVNDSDVNESDDVLFDAGDSTAPSGIDRYEWDFDGDGDTDRETNESTTVYSYDGGGEYDAAVTIVPAQGDEDTDTASVTVQEEEALDGDDGEEGSSGGHVGGSDGDGSSGGGAGGGGGGSAGPPPVVTDVEQRGANAALVDVQNARSDESVDASLPESEVAAETGVRFEGFDVDLASDDPHVAFETAVSAEAPGEVSAPTEVDGTLAYLDIEERYLDEGVEGATVEFSVQKSALDGLTTGEDVSLYRYDGEWERVDTEVVEETDDAYRLSATADGLGALAVGTTEAVTVTDADLDASEVAAGDAVTATATVENADTDARTVDVELAFDDTVVTAETVELSAGETREVTLTAAAGDPGTYDVRVGGAAVEALTVTERGPADIAVADVSLSESTIAPGEEVEITATVENAGGTAGEYNATLTLFGEELRTETVEVPAGETTEVTFVQRIDAGGTYTAEVGDETAEIEVTSESDGDGGVETPGVPGFGVGTALVALLAGALLARFRG